MPSHLVFRFREACSMIPILQMRRLRLREIKTLAQKLSTIPRQSRNKIRVWALPFITSPSWSEALTLRIISRDCEVDQCKMRISLLF